ncbi:Serum paraoxonase/arylesterase [Lachnellula occidentalis]|uniref:Serum paraoxonase/arylesterase n=1 Tax=Lachnellula occidentalis TaxID=215460 RepID=A0A8H8RRW7_9HELO|nr:Serum paraoxonase/arylesterase [Lachnellula occidentalis]
MVSLASKAGIVGVVFIGILYQFIIKSLVFDVLGFARKIDSIKAYSNVRCEKIEKLGLEGCEDMWMHEKTGYLYMACSDTKSRLEWLPAVDRLNAHGRTGKDRVAVVNTRGSGPLSSRIQWLTVEDFMGVKGVGVLDLHGLDIRADENTDTLHILLINHRPAVDAATGEFLDGEKVGANSTVEQFQTVAGSSAMRYVRTYAHDVIQTPNRVAWVDDQAFVFTNDHSGKVGTRRALDPLLGGGSVGYCDGNGCHIAYSKGLNFPNGLIQGRDGLIYVPNSATTNIAVFSLTEDHLLEQVHVIKSLYPIDNLSVDGKGDIYAASFPSLHLFTRATKDPFNVDPPSAVVKISRDGKGFQGTSGRAGAAKWDDGEFIVEKLMEDDGSVLPGSTIAIHDSQTGRVFLGGAMSPFITICETR